MGQQGFWDFNERHQKLAAQKGFLLELDELVPWEVFRPSLERLYDKPRKSRAGRKPIDVIVMFKRLVLQQMYTISDDELEYQVNDRLSFMQFLHLGLEDGLFLVLSQRWRDDTVELYPPDVIYRSFRIHVSSRAV